MHECPLCGILCNCDHREDVWHPNANLIDCQCPCQYEPDDDRDLELEADPAAKEE